MISFVDAAQIAADALLFSSIYYSISRYSMQASIPGKKFLVSSG
jgi:hypothetical protein